MSKLMLLNKTKAKHYRIISNQTFYEPDSDDLLVELKNYRNLKLRREMQMKIKTPTGKTQRICNSEDLRIATTEHLTPKPNLQEALKLKHSKVLEKFKFSGRSNSASHSNLQLKNFLEHFQYFKDLRIEVELNSEIVKGKTLKGDKARALHALLTDKLSENSFEIKNSDEVFTGLKDLCCVFRDVLRILNDKEVDDEVVNLELVWRLALKLIDSSLVLQASTVNEIMERSEKSIKEMNEKCTKKIADMRVSMEEVTKSLRSQIADQKKNIKFIKRQNYYLDDLVKQKEAYIADLLEPESQDKSCEIMRSTLKKLNLYIKESENEQIIQANALKNLSNVIAIAEEINKKPDATSLECQTTCSLSQTPLPLDELKLSSHPYQVFYTKGPLEASATPEILPILESCLNSSDGSLPFEQEVLLAISAEYETKSKISKAVQQMVLSLKSSSSPSSRLFLSLLRIENDYPSFLSAYVLQINRNLTQQAQQAEPSPLTLPKLLDFYYTYLEDGSDTFEKVLEKLSYSCNNSAEDRLSVLTARLYLACTRSRTLESTQVSKTAEDLRQTLKTTTSWVVSKNDLNFFFDNVDLQPDSDLSALFASVAGRVFSIRVDKFDFLLRLSRQVLKKVTRVNTSYASVWAEEHFDNFADMVQAQRAGPQALPDKSVKLAFIQNLMLKDRREILESVLDYDFSNARIRNSLMLRRKPAKKGRKK